jgi:hypothetical protein
MTLGITERRAFGVVIGLTAAGDVTTRTAGIAHASRAAN